MKRLVLLLAAALSVAAADAVKEVRKTLPLEPNGRVVIDTYKGTIEVSAWDQKQVEIYARVEADQGLLGHDRECVDRTEVRIDAWPDSVRIRSDYGRLKEGGGFLNGLFNSCNNLPFVHYRIRMPRTAQIRIKDYKSTIQVADVQGGAEINTYKGSVTGSRVSGRVEVETYKGDARVEFARCEQGGRFQTYRGEIQIRLPKDSKFALATEIGRHAQFDSAFDRNRPVNGGGPLLRLKTYRGTIRLRQS